MVFFFVALAYVLLVVFGAEWLARRIERPRVRTRR